MTSAKPLAQPSDVHDELVHAHVNVNEQAQDAVHPTAHDAGIEQAIAWLADRQHEEGFWVGQLETNCCMEAQWLMAFHLLDYPYPHRDQLVEHILSQQREDGSWAVYFDAPAGDINTTVESYAALRLSGLAASDPRLGIPCHRVGQRIPHRSLPAAARRPSPKECCRDVSISHCCRKLRLQRSTPTPSSWDCWR